MIRSGDDSSTDIENPAALLEAAFRPLEKGGAIDVAVGEPLRFVLARLRKRAKSATPEEQVALAKEITHYRALLEQERRKRGAAYYRKRCANETPEQRAERLGKMTEYNRRRRANETAEQRAQRLAKYAAYARERRAQRKAERTQ